VNTIRGVMRSNPIVVGPGESVRHALELLIENEISGLPVVDAEHRLVGALSEKDLLKVFYEPQALSVEAVMTKDPVSVSIDAELVDVVDALMTSDFRRIFIVEDGKLVGLISRADLMPAVLDALLDRC